MNEKNKKILKSALLAGAGAIATYLLGAIGDIDFGNNAILVVPVVTWLLNTIRVYTK